MIPISEVAKSSIPEGSTIVAQSDIPASCGMGNLNFEKKYSESIEMGLKLLKETPKDCGVWINLMDAYFKGRALSPDYLEKSTYCAKQAILYGHNTGYAEERLAKNLDKAKKYHQSLQLYNLILDNPEFHFSKGGIGNFIDFAKRRASVLKKMDKATDTEDDVLFTPEEIAQVIQSIKDNDAREEAERKAYQERMAKMDAEIERESEEFRKALRGEK